MAVKFKKISGITAADTVRVQNRQSKRDGYHVESAIYYIGN